MISGMTRGMILCVGVLLALGVVASCSPRAPNADPHSAELSRVLRPGMTHVQARLALEAPEGAAIRSGKSARKGFLDSPMFPGFWIVTTERRTGYSGDEWIVFDWSLQRVSDEYPQLGEFRPN
jgi:hypothetical protein